VIAGLELDMAFKNERELPFKRSNAHFPSSISECVCMCVCGPEAVLFS